MTTGIEVVHPFQKLSNFRDVGGLKTVDGRMMGTGLLFRSDELTHLTDQDMVKLQEFNIKLICDLRSPQESKARQPGRMLNCLTRVVNIPILPACSQDGSRKRFLTFLFRETGDERFHEFSREYYRELAFEQAPRIGEIITLLSKEENLPALVHCNAGKDRTGYLAALIQLLMGVPYGAVRESYLQTNDYFYTRLGRFIKLARIVTLFQVSAERMRVILMAHPEYLDGVHGMILQNYGSIERYLRDACHVDQDTLNKLKAALVVDTPDHL
jgi:protein-tyrosine phosphatase